MCGAVRGRKRVRLMWEEGEIGEFFDERLRVDKTFHDSDAVILFEIA